jgi:hypothetical protein
MLGGAVCVGASYAGSSKDTLRILETAVSRYEMAFDGDDSAAFFSPQHLSHRSNLRVNLRPLTAKASAQWPQPEHFCTVADP